MKPKRETASTLLILGEKLIFQPPIVSPFKGEPISDKEVDYSLPSATVDGKSYHPMATQTDNI